MKLRQILAVLIPMTILDAIWLTVMAPRLYKPFIGHLMADEPYMLAAGVFYVMYVLGITYLIIAPAVKARQNKKQVFLNGAVLGLIAYGTYDLTNMATLTNWPLLITIIDMIWGTILTGTVSLIAYGFLLLVSKTD